VLGRVISRHHFDQEPSVVLTYLRQVRFWRDWYPHHHHFEGVDRPLEVGDTATAFLTTEPGSDDIAYAIQWTCVDLWEDRMYRIDGRRVRDGKVADEVTIAIDYILFPTPDGGTDFTREINYSLQPGQPAPRNDDGREDEALVSIQRELDQRAASGRDA
jgi:hypothetical protein